MKVKDASSETRPSTTFLCVRGVARGRRGSEAHAWPARWPKVDPFSGVMLQQRWVGSCHARYCSLIKVRRWSGPSPMVPSVVVATSDRCCGRCRGLLRQWVMFTCSKKARNSVSLLGPENRTLISSCPKLLTASASTRFRVSMNCFCSTWEPGPQWMRKAVFDCAIPKLGTTRNRAGMTVRSIRWVCVCAQFRKLSTGRSTQIASTYQRSRCPIPMGWGHFRTKTP